MVIEGWGAWDAFYMTVITVTTVGYREVHGCPAPARSSPSCCFSGVGAALYTFTLLATVVVEGGLPKRLQRRRPRMLETIKDHFIVCGYGRIGSIVASSSGAQDSPMSSSSATPTAARGAEDGVLAVEADASREDVLKRVGIERHAA